MSGFRDPVAQGEQRPRIAGWHRLAGRFRHQLIGVQEIGSHVDVSERKAAADESRREWSAIEEEREAARIARRDLKRATRAAAKELAEIKRQQQEILAPEREARWGTEFELIVDPVPDYGQKPAKGFGAVQKV